ncbi:MAG: NADH-quinone oxidoreductase subunit A [Dehalococcoidia bacterium]
MYVFLPTIMVPEFSPELFTQNWTAVAISAVVAAMAIGGMFAASRMLSARRYSEAKLTTYECGIPPTPYAWSNINVRFYIFAILFLIFDVEAVFLFPWAVIFMQEKINESNSLPFYAMMMFLGVLFFAIVYAWKKGVLEWQK